MCSFNLEIIIKTLIIPSALRPDFRVY